MKNKIVIEDIIVAQISATQLSKKLISKLNDRASYEDTDESLREFIVSVDSLLNIETEEKGKKTPNMEFLKEIENLYPQVMGYNYIQVAFI